MSVHLLSPLHIEKLGHPIEEIRVRALSSVFSKYNLQLVDGTNLENTRELLEKLFDWFKFEKHPEEEKVLNLILKILNYEKSDLVLREAGLDNFLRRIDSIEKKLKSKHLYLIDDIKKCILKIKKNEADSIVRHDAAQKVSLFLGDFPKQKCVLFRSLDSPESKSPESSFIYDSSKVESQEEELSKDVFIVREKAKTVIKSPHNDSPFRLEHFPWQSLVSSDRKVLSSIYEGLRYIDNKTSVLHSCQIFADVILKDFPTEIFIQRPLTIQTFFELYESEEEEIQVPVLQCLTETVECLKLRFQFGLDVSVISLKQETYADVTFPSVSSEDTRSERSVQFHLNLASSEDELQLDSEEEEDGSLRRHRLSLPKFCFALVSHVAPHLARPCSLEEHNLILTLLDESLSLLTNNLKPGIWCHEQDVKEKFYQILGLLTDSLKHQRTRNKIIYVVILVIVIKLLRSLNPPSGFELGEILPRGLQMELAVCVSDFVLVLIYPKLHEQIILIVSQLIGQKEKEIVQDFKDAHLVCRSMEAAVKFLTCKKFKRKFEKLQCAELALPSLSFHRNFAFVREFVGCCLQWSKSHLRENEMQLRDQVLIKLLSHSDGLVKNEVYKEIHKIVVMLLGVEEAAKPKFQHPGDKVEFLFQSSVLTEVICHGVNSESAEVRKYASEIIIHLLKSKYFMSEELWTEFLFALHPSLPLLQCFADKSTALGRCVSKMLDPDVAASIQLSPLDVLRGNLRLLFVKDSLTREEAISRLCWILTKEDPNGKKLPKMSVLEGVNLTSVCSSAKPQEPSRARQFFYSVGSLCDVIEMLCAIGVEPSVRRSALSQISVMLEDAKLHSTFLEQNGLAAVLSILENCLVEKEFHNYPDSVLPIINILKLISLHNPTTRQELSVNSNVYLCILRGLFLFSGDERLRQEAAELLCLLLYSDHIIVVPLDKAIRCKISLPELVVARMCLPLLTHIHWRNSKHLEPDQREPLMRKANCASLVRIYWSAQCFDGLPTVLALECEDLSDEIFSPNCPDDMKLTRQDLISLKSSCLNLCLKQGLYNIQNATTHGAVIACIHKLHSCLMLYKLLKTPSGEDPCDLADMPWKGTFERFLSSMPSCQEDELLLSHLVRFLQVLLKVSPTNDLTDWMTTLLTDELRTLPNILKTIGSEEVGIVGRQMRHAAIEFAQDVIVRRPDCDVDKWALFVNIVSDHLKLNKKQEFYNVAYIDWLLSLLVDITGRWKWNYTGKRKVYEEVVERVMEIIVAFHCSKDSTRSFMGMNIVKNSLYILNHLLSDVQHNTKGWEQLWLDVLAQVRGHSEEPNYCWLLSLWFVRDPLIRAASLQLLAGFATTARGCELLMERLGIQFEHVWNYGFQILLDGNECSLVREKCALLLSNLTNHGSSVTSAEFLLHLQEIQLYSEMSCLVSKLRFKSTFDEMSDLSDSASFEVAVTPSLLTAVCSLLFNIAWLNPGTVTKEIVESGLFDDFMSCFREAPELPSNPDIAVEYKDVINMYIGICAFLGKCARTNAKAFSLLVQSQHCISSLYNMLNHELYWIKSPSSLILRNRLWCEILDLFSTILTGCKDADTDKGKVSGPEETGFATLNHAMTSNGTDPFVSCLYLAMLSESVELRQRSLQLLINLLGFEMRTRGQWTVADVLDRSISRDAEETAAFDMWKGFVLSETKTGHFGTRICDVMLQIYKAVNSCKKTALRSMVYEALASLLALCQPAQNFCVQHGLIESVTLTLRQIFVKLNLETVESLRKLSDKKRLDPLMNEMESLFKLMCNLMLGNEKSKVSVAESGLSDLVHKFWPWCNARPPLLVTTLKMLCTYTYESNRACQSLLMLSSLSGLGLRKSPGSMTLIHAIMNQVIREMDLISKTHRHQTLQLCLQILSNCCSVTECRSAIAKGQFLQHVARLHPSLSIKRKFCGDELIDVWLQFLIVFTSHQEGQLSLAKNPDVIELLILISTSSRPEGRIKALTTLRNICVHQLNRLRMLSSAQFLTLLLNVLSSKQPEVLVLTAHIIWSLSYNSQKAKIILRTAGFTSKLQQVRRQLVLMDEVQALSVIDDVISILDNK